MTKNTKDILKVVAVIVLAGLGFYGIAVGGESQKYDGTGWYWVSGFCFAALIGGWIWLYLYNKSKGQ